MGFSLVSTCGFRNWFFFVFVFINLHQSFVEEFIWFTGENVRYFLFETKVTSFEVCSCKVVPFPCYSFQFPFIFLNDYAVYFSCYTRHHFACFQEMSVIPRHIFLYFLSILLQLGIVSQFVRTCRLGDIRDLFCIYRWRLCVH